MAETVQYGKVVKLMGFGGCGKLKVCEEDPGPVKPSGHQVCVQIKACGMNFSDLYFRMGFYTFKNIKPPFVMGTEAAGIVKEVGGDVANLKVGDRVACWNFTCGLYAENVILPENQCFPIPSDMSYEVAASIPINYVTAYLSVFDYGNLRPGQNIFIQGAAGGVGIAATQLAKTVQDVTVFGTASSSKHAIIKANGVTHCIDYHSVDFVDEIKRISPTGVNVIVESHSGKDFVRAQKLLAPLGHIILIGASSIIQGERISWLRAFKVWWQAKNISILNLTQKNYSVAALNIATLMEEDPSTFRHVLGQIMNLYSEGKIKPHIDCVLPFEKIVQAHERISQRKNIGKIILVPELETRNEEQ